MNHVVLEGFCTICESWQVIKVSTSWLPEHDGDKKKRCKNSEYSPSGHRYVVNDPRGARELAELIKRDTSQCLSGGRHSLGCGDGDYCAVTRRMRAQALAEFMLTHLLVPA